ncbi:methyltransferase family protein [Rathayibacter sp. PhB93]|uniref:class I SAM-dependent DNA methyltransferase n=1 Tax=unclassified Rathayibacter TaxID=2609250 RepID=UPI000F4A7A8B|nr:MULTISPECIES: class I SAM-dependent methyltransferase [unclassified Rathayibacter]ROQ03839.1 methyltransferase family protein [Rathayibacter sp. PhB93]TDQ10865.1 methyltransferase family protein [Rathayibacter sp. PhB1]
MTEPEVRDAYGVRADEYTALLGSVDDADPRDRALIDAWAAGLTGPVLDAGCGPGHWTAFLRQRGLEAEGVDLVPEFVAVARRRFPGVPFRTGTLREPGADGSLGGILAWYSLIHLPPAELPEVLGGFARALRPGGALLIGFFVGAPQREFAHAVLPAWFHPLESMRTAVADAGFEVVAAAARTSPGVRDHGEIVARKL